jgi:arsenite methyltransferase
MMDELTPEKIHQEVKATYGRIADEFKLEVAASCCGSGDGPGCCADDGLFSNIYASDTTWLPGEVTGLSLGCGDPIALAELSPGQTVLDLGSGGGIDCFMAARQVGPTGRVIGVDMTEAMLEKARRNLAQVGLDNVEFRQGQIEALPVADASVDVIISNCVINLSPDKTAVFHEAHRVLKPGGRLAVSDIVTLGQFSPAERADMAAWTGCITGASDVADLVAAMQQAGFEAISIRDKARPEVELADSPHQSGPAQVLSARITAVRPE